MRRGFGINKTFWLMHVYPSCKITVEICCPDVKLTHMHALNGNNRKKNAHRVMFNNRTESFVVVNAMYLTVPLRNE